MEKVTGPTIKDRITGNVYSVEKTRQMVENAKVEARDQAIIDTFFKNGGLSLVEQTIRECESIYNKSGTRDGSKIIDDPRFEAAFSMANKVLRSLEEMGGEIVGWSKEKGYDSFEFNWPKSQNANDNYVLIDRRLRTEMNARATVTQVGLKLHGKTVIRAQIAKA